MPISDFKTIDNDFLYSDFIKYDYKFGDLDLMSSGGLLGNSTMNFGLFYYEIEKDENDNTRFKFKTFSNEHLNESQRIKEFGQLVNE